MALNPPWDFGLGGGFAAWSGTCPDFYLDMSLESVLSDPGTEHDMAVGVFPAKMASNGETPPPKTPAIESIFATPGAQPTDLLRESGAEVFLPQKSPRGA